MKRMIVLAIAVALAVPVSAVAEQSEVASDELRQAHEELQQALQKIRELHRAGDGDASMYFGMPAANVRLDVQRPRMGVVVESAREGGVSGALIVAVTPGGPAEEAGIEARDVITHIDGVALAGGDGRPHEVLIRQLRDLEEGDRVTIDYVRGDDSLTASVVLRTLDSHVFEDFVHRMPHDIQVERFAPRDDFVFPHGWLDMELVSLNSDLGEYFGVDEGVLVVRAPDSEEFGLEGGDVIISIDDRIVQSPTHAMRILRSYEQNERVAIEVMRHGSHEVLETTVPDHRVKIERFFAPHHDDE